MFDHLEAVIMAFTEYEDNWDGHGGRPAIPEAAAEAIFFLREIMPLTSEVPVTEFCTTTGAISFHWDLPHESLELEFVGDEQVIIHRDFREVHESTSESFFIHELPDLSSLIPQMTSH